MAKKDKKGSDAKALAKEEKRRKQEAKSQKKAGKKSKSDKKGGNVDSDEDLDAILAELRAQDEGRTAVTVEPNAQQPSPRSNFSLCPLQGTASSELLLFGGELYDGNSSDCYNDLYRFSLDKLEWKKISSPNTPDHRNAHQAVAMRDAMYIFGGEFSKGFQFQHYRDLWKLDLKTNAWHKFDLKTGPSPRSGHRMVLWKNFLVLFGGFYETTRGVHFYDDLYFFDLREEKWHLGIAKKSSGASMGSGIKPSARSGFQFQCYSSKNTIFLFGGYSKVSVSVTSERGRNLNDMWALHLTPPTKAGQCPDFRWERVANKGAVPTKRSGAASCVHKNRLILFGGVTDHESSNDVVGEFHNTLHAFDMERLKWFVLNVGSGKSEKKKKEKRRKKDKDGASVVSSLESLSLAGDSDNDNEEEEQDELDDFDANDFGLDDNAFYVIIDGKLTKIDYEDEDEDEEGGAENHSRQHQEAFVCKDSLPVLPEDDEQLAPVPPPTMEDEDISMETAANNSEEAADRINVAADIGAQSTRVPAATCFGNADKGGKGATAAAPMPRIGSGLATMGSKLFVFGGTTEVGDQQITFDDLWTVDLNKMDGWTQLVEGSWKSLTWKGNDDDLDEEGNEDIEDDYEEGDLEDEEFSVSEGDEATNEAFTAQRHKTEKELAAELRRLRDELQLGDDTKTPLPKESLRDFFKRTGDAWIKAAFAGIDAKERLSGKEVRAKAFKSARTRFDELLPALQQLDELEEQQKMAEEMQELDKQRLLDKLKEKAKKRKAHMAKIEKKDRKKKEAEAAMAEEESDSE